MSKFINTLKDSFKLLLKEPKLFLPKIFIAFLYSLPIIAVPAITIDTILLRQANIELLAMLIFWIVYLTFVMFIDVLINAMYPFMVQDFYKKRPVSFLTAFKNSLKKFFVVIPAVLIAEIIAFVAIIIIAIPLSVAIVIQNYLLAGVMAAIFILIIFALSVLFYLIYPVTTLEKGNFISSLIRSISLAMRNKADVSKATALTFFISFITIALAFAIELMQSPELALHIAALWAIFILLRIIIAMFYTYQYVLNPVFYLEYERGMALG